MQTYTASVTGPGALAGGFEQMLDVLPAAALQGDENSERVTLWFDVRAASSDAAIEQAYLRAHSVLRDTQVEIQVVRSYTIEGRRPWWRRWLDR